MLKNRGLRVAGGLLLIAALAIALVACGSDEKDDTAAKTGEQVSTTGKKLSDCEYAKQFTQDVDRFTTGLTSASTASISSKEQAVQAFDKLDADLGALLAQMKGYQLSADVAKVNSGFITIFEDVKKQIPDMRKAAGTGDVTQLTQFSGSFAKDLGPRLDKIQQDNKGAVDKLNKCQA